MHLASVMRASNGSIESAGPARIHLNFIKTFKNWWPMAVSTSHIAPARIISRTIVNRWKNNAAKQKVKNYVKFNCRAWH
jgi:hypothetical protein